MLCDDLEGWDREDGREAQAGGDMGTCVCIWLIRFVVQQELTQYCEAIILRYRLKKKKKQLLWSNELETTIFYISSWRSMMSATTQRNLRDACSKETL